ncbi:hypothetical protein Syun_028147 [Stephania yunnanensis]|uniref:Uncharacterized protein n=1 Tax=Stephania yunnanensis TaxID=152371 RepID=A0AAP0EGU0_9MAGN
MDELSKAQHQLAFHTHDDERREELKAFDDTKAGVKGLVDAGKSNISVAPKYKEISPTMATEYRLSSRFIRHGRIDNSSNLTYFGEKLCEIEYLYAMIKYQKICLKLRTAQLLRSDQQPNRDNEIDFANIS